MGEHQGLAPGLPHVLSCHSACRLPQSAWPTGTSEKVERLDGRRHVDAVVNSIFLSVIVTLQHEHVLEFITSISSNCWTPLVLIFSLAADTTSCSWLQNSRIAGVWGSNPLSSDPTWKVYSGVWWCPQPARSWSLIFTNLTSTSRQTWKNISVTYTVSGWKDNKRSFCRLFAASRGSSSPAESTLSHRTSIT
jgi:hypothetical protein